MRPAPANPARNSSFAGSAAGRRPSRRTTLAAALGVLALVAGLVPALLQAQAAGATATNPIGSLDSVAIGADGAIAALGWAADADAPTTALRVDLSDNGVQKTWVRASTARADVASAHPSFGAAHGFSFRLVAGEGSHQLCATAENLGGGASTQLGCRTVTVHNNPSGTMSAPALTANTVTFTGTAVDANSTNPVIVSGYVDGRRTLDTTAAGTSHSYSLALPVSEGSHSICLYAINIGAGANIRLGCQAVVVHNNPLGALESAGQVPTGVSVTGYAIDLNTTSPVSVWAFVDGVLTARTLASAPRPDLATSYPSSGPDHGYSMLLALASGSHTVCAWAINIGPGANTQLGCSRVTVQNNPIGNVESVRQLPSGVQVAGWAMDLNSTGPVTVSIFVDGKAVTSASASAARPDLTAHYPTMGANHGYAVLVAVPAGNHTVCVDAVNIGAGANSRLRCLPVTVQNNPIGSIDTARQVPGGAELAGWALDLNSIAPVSVFVYVDGRYTTRVTASTSRSDLASHYPTVGGGHGYSLLVPMGPGKHTVCGYAINTGPGVNSMLPCKVLTLKDVPLGNLEVVQLRPGGVSLAGWAMDAFSTAASAVRVYVDSRPAAGGAASASRPDLLASFPNMGAGHGFTIFTPLSVGIHRVCTYVINPRHATNLGLRCVSVSRLANPVGSSTSITRTGTTNTVTVTGWALDPDSLGPIVVHVFSDGVDKQTVTANAAVASVGAAWPAYGTGHGYSAGIALDANEHTVCVTAYNVGEGRSTVLGCTLITTSGEAAPAVPVTVTAWAGSKSVTLGWTAPRSDNAPITSYQITNNQRGTVTTVGATSIGAVVGGLTNGLHYTFSVRALNSFGRGSAATVGATPTNIPPQITPAPVSTSHYLRNLTGNLTSDAALMRAMGAADASRNPSGHTYLVLLQIGGQDEADHGVLLSAIARYVSYASVVSAMKAYLDGYATRQQPYAPLTLAIGTNNDVDVSTASGLTWARTVVSPVQVFAAAHHPGVIIAGANDMEPGFSATVGQTRAWLSGYLAGTSAAFVFNGSADGCSTATAGGGCNNHWTMADLQWLSGGAAPTRTISLPQIYNYAMPLQWKYISLTGTNGGRPRINFGGPLTERTACDQAGSCGSITNTDAWTKLWSAISSTAATKQSQLPHGTDLRIN
ncbi:MAG: fibronectin type III domain-containing protein [Jatrophihabitans sp.]